MARKRGVKIPVAFEIHCPTCKANSDDAAIPAPSGSLFWTVDEMATCDPPLRVCAGCGNEVTIPSQ